jgi:GNAT superfamily N-acetyltransferase
MTKPSDVLIEKVRPDSPEAAGLIAELEAYLQPLYPPSNQHGLSIDEMIAEGVDFFILRDDGQAAACGGIKNVSGMYAEIKRIYVRPDCRGKGFGRRILAHLEQAARKQGLRLLRLETGIYQPEAIALYEKAGYRRIGPFGEYQLDPLSIYYEKELS